MSKFKLLLSMTLVCLVAFSSVVLIGITATASGEQKVLNLLLTYDPDSIDPTFGLFASSTIGTIECMFEPLVRFDFNSMTAVPALAKSWTVSEDGLVWTFDLRDDVTWSNGKPVTAHDVEYSYKRIVDPAVASPLSGRLTVIKGAEEVLASNSEDLSSVAVKALDDYTVQFTLARPAGYFLSLLSTVGWPIPKDVVEEYGDKWTDPANIVTDGPYLLKSFVHYSGVDLEKNPNYYDAQNVDIDVVHFIYVKEASTGLAMYEAGEIDTVSVAAVDLDRIRKDPILSKEYTGPISGLAVQDVSFNTTKAPFDNVLVRKAFAAATDRDTIANVIMNGSVVPSRTFAPSGVPSHVPDSMDVGIPHNPEKARAYLAAAGYPGGDGFPEVTFTAPNTQEISQFAQALQKMWQDVLGVKVKVLLQEGRVWFPTMVAGEYQFWRASPDGFYPDGHEFLYNYFDSTYGGNIIRWNNQEFDALVEKADGLQPNDPERNGLYMRAEEILVQEQAAVIPINYSSGNYLTKPYLKRLFFPTSLLGISQWKMDK